VRALVTGSEGFIGRHITAGLLAAGYEVVGVDPCEEFATASSDCRVWFATRLGEARFDLVVHCAALVDGRETIEHKAALLAAYNLQLDGAMFEWALQARPGRIVYFSSSAAYPTVLQNGSHRLTEGDIGWHRGEPDASYGWVKLTGERVAAEVRKAGVPVTIVRPFSGYGEDQDDCYPFPAMIQRAVRGDEPFVVWGDGQQVRDFIHVDDIVNAVLALVEAEANGPVNLGTGRAVSMDALARMAMDACGYRGRIKHLSDKPVGVRFRVANTALMDRYYTPKVPLEEGVRRAVEAAR
jgi:nucleoside-diphosphate-sugar epimerase